MYNWTQSDCDNGFLNKMKAVCVNQPDQTAFSVYASTKGKMMSYLEFFKRIYDGYKKATQNGTKAEAQRVWDECQKLLSVFRQWIKASQEFRNVYWGPKDIIMQSVLLVSTLIGIVILKVFVKINVQRI
ncbi:uncharacterized protein [Clytia hemisphaerica]|uniref:Uncharacterized protein n=1 Tax=Clytia hemisphaerica TaxID=252671 RepID=A0A7M5XEL2_9CNID